MSDDERMEEDDERGLASIMMRGINFIRKWRESYLIVL